MMTFYKSRIYSYAVTAVMLVAACTKKEHPTPAPEPPAESKKTYAWTTFVMGADLSYVNAVQNHGGVYKDSGVAKDPFLIFKAHGANTVRVRLWHHPQWQQPLNGGRLYSDLADAEKTIQRAKTAGMAVCLDLHYSDRWADPAHQQTPAAWQNLDLPTLRDSVYQYTLKTLTYLQSKNAIPEFVQVGNEINTGMLFPLGEVANGDWTAFAQLLNSGIKAVRDFSTTASVKPQIILHVAKLTDADWWAGNIIANGVTDFGILGISHYPMYSTITSMQEVSTIIRNLKTKFNKKILLMETAYPWTNQSADAYTNLISGATGFAGYGVSKEEQYRFLKDLTQQVISGGGSGVLYWEPAWITSAFKDEWGTGSAWENNAFFDFSGNALPALDFMNYAYTF